jgi:hypothetical protein
MIHFVRSGDALKIGYADSTDRRSRRYARYVGQRRGWWNSTKNQTGLQHGK